VGITRGLFKPRSGFAKADGPVIVFLIPALFYSDVISFAGLSPSAKPPIDISHVFSRCRNDLRKFIPQTCENRSALTLHEAKSALSHVFRHKAWSSVN